MANDHRGTEIDIVVKGSEPLHTPFRLDLRRHLLEGTVTGHRSPVYLQARSTISGLFNNTHTPPELSVLLRANAWPIDKTRRRKII